MKRSFPLTVDRLEDRCVPSGSPWTATGAWTSQLSNFLSSKHGNPGKGTPPGEQGVVTLSSPGDQTNSVGDTVYLSVSATDSDGAALAYSATGLPNGLSIDPNQGIISGTVALGAASNSTTITVTDTASNESANVTINWTVQDPAPVVVSPGDQSNLVGDSVYVPVPRPIRTARRWPIARRACRTG